MEQAQESYVYNRYIQFFISGKYKMQRHYLSLFILAFLVLMGITADAGNRVSISLKIPLLFFIILLVYVNMYFLVPVYLLKRRYRLYVSGIGLYIVLSCTVLLVTVFWFQYSHPHLYLHHDTAIVHRGHIKGMIFYVLTMLSCVGASTAVMLFRRWIVDSQRLYELERTTMAAELNQLKSQINPHFLFNVLNNANVLIFRAPDRASQLILKMSDLLRYQLYDSTREKVLLTAEINFLTDFLNLEKTRRDDFYFDIEVTGAPGGVMIAPLLLIIFVENAVKHNVGPEQTAYVDISIHAEAGQLSFQCRNPAGAAPAAIPHHAGGIGLANVKRRLELLYPRQHTLTLNHDNNVFSVALTMEL